MFYVFDRVRLTRLQREAAVYNGTFPIGAKRANGDEENTVINSDNYVEYLSDFFDDKKAVRG